MFRPLRSRWSVFLYLFLTASGSLAQEAEFRPAAPDPLFQDRVAGPITVAGLHLRLASEPAGMVAWEFLKESRSLTDDQLRTLLHDLLRTRRYYGNSVAESLVLECCAHRNLEEAVADVMHIPDWEDSIRGIGDYDSDVEYFGRKLWERLTVTDLPAALRLADALAGTETRRQILSDGSDPEQTAAEAIRCVAENAGMAAARAAVETLPPGPRRSRAEAALAECRELQPKSPPEFPDNPVLTKLAAMDTTAEAGYPGRSPLPLLEEVLRLSPEAALGLARQLKSTALHMSWLGWMLFHRAAEGDPDAALEVAATPGALAGIPHASAASAVWALKAGQPGVAEQIRAIPPGDARNAAVRGYFGRVKLNGMDPHIALAKELAVPASACAPLFVRMVRAARATEAMALAATLTGDGSAGDSTCEGEILKAWCLTDVRSAIRFLEPRLAREESLKSVRWQIAEAFSLLPSRLILDSLSSATLTRLDYHEMFYEEFWLYIATEDIEAGFRFFDRVSGDERFRAPLQSFASVAARYQPERAKALLKAAGPAEKSGEQ